MPFIKTFAAVFLLLYLIPVFSQDEVVPEYSDYAAALSSAQTYAKSFKYEQAIQAYHKALNLATSDVEKANAYTGLGDSYLLITVKTGGPGKYGTTKTGDPAMSKNYYEKAAELPGAPLETRLKAMFAIAELYGKEYNAVSQRAQYDKMLGLPNLPQQTKFDIYMLRAKTSYPLFDTKINTGDTIASDLLSAYKVPGIADDKKADALKALAENYAVRDPVKSAGYYLQIPALKGASASQKVNAYQKVAKQQQKEGKLDDARNTMSKILTLKDIKAEEKAEVHQFAARTYLEQKKPDLAVAEILKIDDISLDSNKQIEIHGENGRLLFSYNLYPAARAEFEKTLKYTSKKSYNFPRNTIYIARTFEAEKNYDEARKVLNKLLLMPIVAAYEKEDGWIMMGNMYNEEKQYQQAVDAFTVLGDNPNLGQLKKIKVRMGLARAMYGMQYFTDAKENYMVALQLMEEADKAPATKPIPNMSPYDVGVYKTMRDEWHKEAKKRVEEIVAKGN